MTNTRFVAGFVAGSFLWPASLPSQPLAGPANPTWTALRFAHHYATPAALTPGNDRPLKIKLITNLSKSSELRWDAWHDVFDADAMAGNGGSISLARMEALLAEKAPPSRKAMNAKTRLHADLLATQFDLIEQSHYQPAEKLVNWVVEHYQRGKPLGVITICTGNTRRSILGAAMGNLAATYYGMPEVRFCSGGTTPDAFNPRTVATLQEIGVEIERTGQEAPRGPAGTANPIYRVRWGKNLETMEFSKKYTDASNPQRDFAALMVCSEADVSCPTVTGAGIRIPMSFIDPKAFDGVPFEAAKYAERRDDIGRLMLSVMMQARRRLELAGKLK